MPSTPPSNAKTNDARLASAPDLAIIGGGIVGLWCALRAAQLGLRTVLLEKRAIGQGASGGFLGALMPHQPMNWSPVKAFQLEALMSLETEIAQLQQRTGVDCGYHRCGRLIPTHTEKKRAERADWRAAAEQNWPQLSPGGKPLHWHLRDTLPDPNWLSPQAAPLGCEYDTMSARIDPRGLLRALTSAVGDAVLVREHTRIARLDDGGIKIVLDDGTELSPGRVILTAGHETFELLKPVTGRRLGRGVKGQAALLQPTRRIDPSAPIVFLAGLYVIAHRNGQIAVGSTSENEFADPDATDHKLEKLIARATELCPAIEDAEIVERWAGVRPNAIGRHPMIGPLPEAPNIIVCTGGFKVSFAIAHRMADAALGFITGKQTPLPELFKISSHYARAESQLTH